jgi:hypothetical protein
MSVCARERWACGHFLCSDALTHRHARAACLLGEMTMVSLDCFVFFTLPARLFLCAKGPCFLLDVSQPWFFSRVRTRTKQNEDRKDMERNWFRATHTVRLTMTKVSGCDRATVNSVVLLLLWLCRGASLDACCLFSPSRRAHKCVDAGVVFAHIFYVLHGASGKQQQQRRSGLSLSFKKAK